MNDNNEGDEDQGAGIMNDDDGGDGDYWNY
jgi:hypothetical protein